MRFLLPVLLLVSFHCHGQLKVGDPAPNLLGKTMSGDPVLLESFRGKVLVVTFWASWCGPCRKELPGLNALQNAVGTEFIQVVAVNSKEDNETVRAIMRQLKDRKLVSSFDRSGDIGESFGVNAFPNLWIIDPEGVIVMHKVGYGEDSLKSIIAEIIETLKVHNPEALDKPIRKT
jgi:thiol-disulfide isomerase/thioredoxin